jgi:hypothetical protein
MIVNGKSSTTLPSSGVQPVSDANARQIGGTHYKGAEYQHWDWVTDIKLPYLPGVGSKYVFRWRRRSDIDKGIEDLEKALHYMDKSEERSERGSIDSKRQHLFWKLVLANEVYINDAAVIWAIMEGEWELARAGIKALLQSAQPPSS